MKLNRWYQPFLIACAASVIAACSGSSTPVSITMNGSVSSGGSLPAVAITGATVSIYKATLGAPELLAQTTTDGAGRFTAKVTLSDDGTSPNLYYCITPAQASRPELSSWQF